MSTPRVHRAKYERLPGSQYAAPNEGHGDRVGTVAGRGGRFRVTVRSNVARDWPHGRVVVDDVEITPNHARRLVAALEEAIARAEEKRW